MSLGHVYRLDKVAHWVARSARSAGLANTGNLPSLVSTWQSRTATLHRFQWPPPSSTGVVVKIHHDPQTAATHFRSLCEVAAVADGLDFTDHNLSVPIAYSDELGAVLMPYAAGRSLANLLSGGSWYAKDFSAQMLQYVSGCGALLARYHNQSSKSTDLLLESARAGLENRVARVLGHHLDLQNITISSMLVARSYGDFHPGHVIITDSGKLVLLDPPIDKRYRFVHRDIALFTYNLFIILLQPRALWAQSRRLRQYGALMAAFHAGYAVQSEGLQLTDEDRFLIDTHEAFLLQRALQRQAGTHPHLSLAYYFAPALYRFKKLRRRMISFLQQRSDLTRHQE